MTNIRQFDDALARIATGWCVGWEDGLFTVYRAGKRGRPVFMSASAGHALAYYKLKASTWRAT